MDRFQKVKDANTFLKIKHVKEEDFLKYGKVITGYDFSEIEEYMLNKSIMPSEGNIYKASVEEMEKYSIYDELSNNFYGGMEIQIGYCNGNNSNLNALEYHKGSEINFAVTDMVLLLGDVRNIKSNKFYSDDIEAFYLPKGTAVEIYQTTLHFAPCKVSNEGFKCVVVLPRGTNSGINKDEKIISDEDKLLFMRNKWLITHPEKVDLIQKGAYPGIIGKNIEVKY